MNLQPTIFISSIISEFYDLRGALKYFLGKSGFRVLMSEEPDFGADCDKDSLENCRERIFNSDYYFLIIGVNPGFKFNLADGKETSVTFEEFKHFLELKSKGQKINLIAFVRKQAWDYYNNKDFKNMSKIQHDFISELINNSLLDSEIGRWRYTFDKFAEIITVLETNQNGLFIEATRKISIYRTYLKTELTYILKSLLISNKDGKGIRTLNEFIDLPDIKFADYFTPQKVDENVAIRIISFVQFYSYKQELLLKINRVFNYIAQGEFAIFNPEMQSYEQPDYIKLTIQALEILEKTLINFQQGDLYKKMTLLTVDTDNFYLTELEFDIVKSQLADIEIATLKLINLMICLHNNWNDFAKSSGKRYEYRGLVADAITTEEIIEFSNNYFDKK